MQNRRCLARAVGCRAGRRGRGAGSALLLHRCLFSKLGLAAVDGELRCSGGAQGCHIFPPPVTPGTVVCPGKAGSLQGIKIPEIVIIN